MSDLNIPVIQLVNVASFIGMSFVAWHVWSKATSSAFKSFAWSITFASVTLFFLSIPRLVISDPFFLQLTSHLVYLFLGIMLAFMWRMIALLTIPRSQVLTVVLPPVLIMASAIFFLMQNFTSPPTDTVLFTIPHFPLFHFIDHPNTSSPYIILFYNTKGVLVFGLGAILFYFRSRGQTGVLRKRGLMLGTVFVLALVVMLMHYVVIAYPWFYMPHSILESIMFPAMIVLMYKVADLRTDEP